MDKLSDKLFKSYFYYIFYLINRGKTLSKGGLNRKDERWTVSYNSLYGIIIIIYLSIILSTVLIFS